MSITSLTPAQLRKAADLKEKIAKLETELASLLGGSGAIKSADQTPKKRGKMSAAGRAKIAAAQKMRWYKIKAARGTVVVKPAKKKFVMSAAAKAKISAAAKARWAAKKAAK
jgi:hypothetical protein